jgi:protein-tyrosine phosphatase
VTRLHWLDGPWRGKLALAARPRGGEWVAGEILAWKRAGIGAVLSLLTAEEEKEFDLREEGERTRADGLVFWSFPIPDMQVPSSETKFSQVLNKITATLSDGKNVLVHCRQGIGRTGLVAACLLIKSGMSPGASIDTVSAARGASVPESAEQREWIERYAPALAK